MRGPTQKFTRRIHKRISVGSILTAILIGLLLTIVIQQNMQKESSATLHFGNLTIAGAGQLQIRLEYTPRNPILFFSEEWNVLGSFTIKLKSIKPELRDLGQGDYSFSFSPQLSGLSSYELTTLYLICQLPDGETLYFSTDITLDSTQSTQQGWLEGNSPQAKNSIGRFIGLDFKDTQARFLDHSKADQYQFFEKTEAGNLQLDEESRPILLADSLPKLQKYLLESLMKEE